MFWNLRCWPLAFNSYKAFTKNRGQERGLIVFIFWDIWQYCHCNCLLSSLMKRLDYIKTVCHNRNFCNFKQKINLAYICFLYTKIKKLKVIIHISTLGCFFFWWDYYWWRLTSCPWPSFWVNLIITC